jgi:Ni,Fe-hydrogenase III large subunit/Ni,Fe-hydrogenase III component G
MSQNKTDIVDILQAKFKDTSIQVQPAQLGKATVIADALTHRDVLKVLLEADEKTAVCAITGIDLGATLGVFYHIRTSKGGVVTIKTEVPREDPRINTINDLMPGAAFHEMEVADLLGVVFVGLPSPGRLVLPDNWPDDVFPLRKDAKLDNLKLKQTTPSETELSGDANIVKVVVGPQHPALLEPEKFVLNVEGEIVKGVEPRIGYVHRGIEKAAESRTYLQDVYLVERICGICNACHASCFVETVEKILKTEVPPRAKYIRTILLELNRLHSHLLTLGHAGLEIGFETLFQYFWRDREPIMDITEIITGNRVISSSLTVGGVRRDIKETDIPKIRGMLTDLRKKLPFYKEVYADEPSVKLRMKNVGTLKREDALELCVVGPTARGSGVDIDVRKDEPYEAYGEIPFKTITYNAGDTWARMNVRMEEVEESINIIEYALDHLPTGPFRVRAPRVVPAGEAVNRVEAPRGELFYYVRSNGTAYPDRVKVRTPTFANIPAFLKTAIGGSIADVPANFVSLDPCFSCTDR